MLGAAGLMLPAARSISGQILEVGDESPRGPISQLLPDEGEDIAIAVPVELRRLVEQLDAPDYATREGASRAIETSGASIGTLCALLVDPVLSGEQRCRLLLILESQLTSVPRGALGISMRRRVGAARREPGIEVVDLVPGLPAEGVLEIGDRITHVDGRPLQSHNQLVVVIQSKAPGADLTFTVRRAARDEDGTLVIGADGRVVWRTLDLTVALGSVARLIDPQTGQVPAPGTVERELERQAGEAYRRYAPRARRLTIPGLGRADAAPAPSDPFRTGD